MFAKFAIYTLAIAISVWLLPGIKVDNTLTLLITAAVLGLINTFIRPVVTFFSLPFVLVTGGLFLIVINALMIMLAGVMIDGFHVDSFWSAAGMALVIFIVWLVFPNDKRRKDH